MVVFLVLASEDWYVSVASKTLSVLQYCTQVYPILGI